MSKKIDKPHDRLIRKLLSNPATAKDVLEVYLPLAIKEKLDLEFLERQPESFVDDEHRIMEVDVLFKTRMKAGDDAYIYILFAQQRNPDEWLPVKKFYYIGTIWNHLRKTSKTKKIPLIYPVIISNASKPYSHSLVLRDLIEPESAQEIFDDLFKKPLCLIDLASIKDDALRETVQNHVRGSALLLSLKHVFDKNLQQVFENMMLSAFKRLDSMGYIDDVADMLLYLLNEGDFPDIERFKNIIHQTFSKPVEERVMTLAERLEQKGIEKVACNLLQEGLDISLIEKTTCMSHAALVALSRKMREEKNKKH